MSSQSHTPSPTAPAVASLTLSPATSVSGSVHLPGSKSLSIRALLLAALCQGETTLSGVLDSDDTRVMIAGLRQLGVTIERENVSDVGEPSNTYRVGGGGFKNATADIFVGNSGLSIRTLAAALAASKGKFRLHGVPRMHERPIADLADSLSAVGAHIHYEQTEGYPPLLIAGRDFEQVIPTIRVKGNASSQYLTGLLQIAPLLAKEQDIVIAVDGDLISKPYVDMTVQLMAQFGVVVARDASQYATFTIGQGSVYQSPKTLAVEGDASSASYFLAAGAIGGHSLTVRGAGKNSLQGDVHFATFLQSIGVPVDWQAQSITVHGRTGARYGKALPAFDQDFNHIPDAAMTAAIVALFTDGRCVLRNIASWRVKETDRLAAMAAELRKVGAVVEEGADWLAVTPPSAFKTASIHTYDDHRMAMCFSLLRLSGIAITIEDPACVNKTFPDFYKILDSVVTV